MKNFKKILRTFLNFFGLNIRYAVVPGISFFGINIHKDAYKNKNLFRAQKALEYCCDLKIKTVLDIGSGANIHANQFKRKGKKVVCVDYGTSRYALESKVNGIEVIKKDFLSLQIDEKFDLIWASHVIEHQKNIGTFIQKMISFCAKDGYFCITIPDPHRHLWGGHLSIWSPGLLAYNIVLSGLDLKDAIFIRGELETSLVFKMKKINLPNDLTFDTGDVDKISKYLPSHLKEDSDPWKVEWF